MGNGLTSLGGSGGNDDGVLHSVVLLKGLDELGDGGSLLTNGDVDAVKLLLLIGTCGLSESYSYIQSKEYSPLFQRAWFSIASRATAVFPV
jgi:hypothetical protein